MRLTANAHNTSPHARTFTNAHSQYAAPTERARAAVPVLGNNAYEEACLRLEQQLFIEMHCELLQGFDRLSREQILSFMKPFWMDGFACGHRSAPPSSARLDIPTTPIDPDDTGLTTEVLADRARIIGVAAV